jgi:myo-inositol-1(or 4)-monophosphatase
MKVDYQKVIEAVKEAGKTALTDTLDTKLKGKGDFVTQVDMQISDILKAKLKELTPQAGFFCEEEKGALQDPCWILDPIDGTTNLVFGFNLSAVSLGLYENGEIVFGIVYNPFTDECFTAEKGKGAWLDGRRLHVSQRDFADSIIEFGAGSYHKENMERNFGIAKDLFSQCLDVRRICSAALALCYIAAGRMDGYFEQVLKPWDIAAGSLILREAGGDLKDYAGSPVQYANPTTLAAGTPNTLPHILETVQKHI